MFTKSPLPPDSSTPYSGALIETLEETVAKAEAADPEQRSKPTQPTLIHKQDGRNYFRLTEMPAHVELHCGTADCANNARVLADSRHGEILPYCKECAHVEFAMWMVGV
jgi:hypothetical protein